MRRVTIKHGDALALVSIEDCAVDAIVTDPPYGLAFMGRAWDTHDTPAWYQDWCEDWATEAYRVLKPGGHMLAFGGTRTYHRLTCGIEDAGFELRDSIAWLYGCLTDDVEVLTETGWRRGIDVNAGDRVAQWDPATGAITTAEVQDTYRAPWSGNLVRFRNADTDQAVTPNHRVWRRTSDHRGALGKAWHQWGDYRVDEAGTISRNSPTRLPLAGLHDGPGIGGEDYAALLGWVWTEGGFDRKPSTGVRIYQSSVNQTYVDEIASLMDRSGPHKRYDYARTYTRRSGEAHNYTAITWFFAGDLAQKVRADLPDKHPPYALLWRMTLAEKKAFLDAALKGDGSKGAKGSWTFDQKDSDDREWFVTLLALVGWRGHNTDRKTPRTGGFVGITQHSDTTLTPNAMLDSHEWYEGDVWCVRVPTGAFVARRHGKVFVTGNSGFPKSLDVSKAIDKAAGAEREVVGTVTAGSSSINRVSRVQQGYRPNLTAFEGGGLPVTAPATDDARRWQGWGTALKPAFEPIVVARKPLAGTVAQNVQTYGTGALNIDGCRVGPDVDTRRSKGHNPSRPSAFPHSDDAWIPHRTYAGTEAGGRWPTNVVLSHLSTVDGGDACASGCVEGCPVAELDAQSGVLTSGSLKPYTEKHVNSSSYQFAREKTYVTLRDTGGASRFFPTFRYQAKAPQRERPKVDGVAHPTVKPVALMRWLCRLVTPPNGLILDQFAGSGATVEAAMLEGFRIIAIDSHKPYLPLIRARVAKTRGPQ